MAEVKGLSPGFHVLSINVTLMRVKDPMPEKMEDALVELLYTPNQPDKTLIQGFPFKDHVHLSLPEMEILIALFANIKEASGDIEKAMSKIKTGAR